LNTNNPTFDVIMLTTVHQATDGRIFHREARTLAKAGFSVCVIGPHEKSEHIDGVWVSAIPKAQSRPQRLLLGWTLLKQALQLSGKLYIFHDPELFWVAPILLARGKRVVFDCHENLPAQVLQKPWIPKPLGWVLVPALVFGLWLGSRILTGVIAVSEVVVRLSPRHRTIVIRNFPDREAMEVSCQGKPPHLRRNIVIYAGGMFRVRGIRELVEAFRGLEYEAELWLAGEFEEEQFRDQILNSLPANVVWHGWKEHPELLKLYQQSKIGAAVLYPTKSHRHSTPTKMFEYLGSGLPVVASNFPEWAELLDGCGVQVDPFDVTQIRDAIRRLVANNSTVASMSAVARERIERHFSWESEGQKLVEYCSRFVH
jgi:glycosyltransferase involved in cell wall biosynthesis